MRVFPLQKFVLQHARKTTLDELSDGEGTTWGENVGRAEAWMINRHRVPQMVELERAEVPGSFNKAAHFQWVQICDSSQCVIKTIQQRLTCYIIHLAWMRRCVSTSRHLSPPPPPTIFLLSHDTPSSSPLCHLPSLLASLISSRFLFTRQFFSGLFTHLYMTPPVFSESEEETLCDVMGWLMNITPLVRSHHRSRWTSFRKTRLDDIGSQLLSSCACSHTSVKSSWFGLNLFS